MSVRTAEMRFVRIGETWHEIAEFRDGDGGRLGQGNATTCGLAIPAGPGVLGRSWALPVAPFLGWGESLDLCDLCRAGHERPGAGEEEWEDG